MGYAFRYIGLNLIFYAWKNVGNGTWRIIKRHIKKQEKCQHG